MSGRISRILDEPKDRVAQQINLLEEKNGFPSHDARFLAENIQKVRTKLSDLKLDPDDTTGEELYHALLVKFKKDSKIFDVYFGTKSLSFDEKNEKAVNLINKQIKLPQQWALKNAAAKNLLRKNPPKHLMKKLGYRSVESMLKRECLAEMYIAAKHIETGLWQKTLFKATAKLKQTDFELRPLKLQPLSFNKWGKAASTQDHSVYADEVAAVGLWPSEDLKKAPFLSIMLLTLEALEPYLAVKSTNFLESIDSSIWWWLDMDHVVADCANEPVSLSISDAAQNSFLNNTYDERTLEHGRNNFWQELVNRYENLPEIDGIFDNSIKDKLPKLSFSAPEPAYEFVEDF